MCYLQSYWFDGCTNARPPAFRVIEGMSEAHAQLLSGGARKRFTHI